MSQTIKISLLSAVIGGIFGAAAFSIIAGEKTSNDRIKEFYATENAVHVSPHGLRQKMSKGQTDGYILVDLRSSQEYEKEHIVTAVNIPAYKDPNTSAYDEKDRIINAFRDLIAQNPNKEIIVYCYSTPCMTGRKVGSMLADAGIYVKHLGIGWNEWRYAWNAWNHDGETPTNVEGFVAKGNTPGVPRSTDVLSPCGEGDLGC